MTQHEGYDIDLQQVAAVGPTTVHTDVVRQTTEAFFLIYLSGGGHIRIDYPTTLDANAGRYSFVNLWMTATAGLGGLCSAPDIQEGTKCPE